MSTESRDQAQMLQHGREMEYFSIVYNCLEGVIAVAAGLWAGSIALMGFGFDRMIEVTSAAPLWRLRADVDAARRERAEAISLRIAGICFLALAACVSYDMIKSLKSIMRHEAPKESYLGITLALISVVVMPLSDTAVKSKKRRNAAI